LFPGLFSWFDSLTKLHNAAEVFLPLQGWVCYLHNDAGRHVGTEPAGANLVFARFSPPATTP